MDPQLNGATPAQLLSWGWKEVAGSGSTQTFEYPNGNKITVNRYTGSGDWMESSGGSYPLRLNMTVAADPPASGGGYPPAAVNLVSKAALNGPQASSSPPGTTPDTVLPRTDHTAANHTSDTLVEQVKGVTFDGQSGLTKDTFSDGTITYHDNSGAIVARSVEGQTPDAPHSAVAGEGGVPPKPPTTIIFQGGSSGDPKPFANPTSPAADPLSENGSGMGAAQAPTLVSNEITSENGRGMNSSLENSTNETHSYTGGAAVEAVKPLANGATLTTTATGAEVETTAAGNSYTAKAAPLEVSNDVSQAVTEHRHGLEDLGAPTLTTTPTANTDSQSSPSAEVTAPASTPAPSKPAPAITYSSNNSDQQSSSQSVAQVIEEHRHEDDVSVNSSPPPAPAAPAPEPQPTIPPAVTLPAPTQSDTPAPVFGGFDTSNHMGHGRVVE